jgi:hypothetical protein
MNKNHCTAKMYIGGQMVRERGRDIIGGDEDDRKR